jgi:hypothetical protein
VHVLNRYFHAMGRDVSLWWLHHNTWATVSRRYSG